MSRNPLSMTDPQKCLGEAIVILRENQPEAARNLAQRAVELGLDDTTVWGVIALANRDLADYENAQLAADRAIARDPRNARAYIVKADVFYAQENMKAAAAFYRQALIINPLHPDMVQEIRVEFLRAQTRVQELQQAFADHMTREVQPLLDDTQSTPRMQAAVDLLLGKRKQYYPQPRHIMYPGLSIHEFHPRDSFPWLETLEEQTEAILEELKGLISGGSTFNAYLESSTDRPAFDSHGMADNDDWGALYLWRNGEPVPENQVLCPVTTAAMNALPLVFSGQRCPNILFSRLRPGAKIPPHNGMINTRLIGHLPLIIPENCGFRVGNTTRNPSNSTTIAGRPLVAVSDLA